MNFRNQIEPQESPVRQGTLAARKLSEHIVRRTAFSRAGPEWLCTLLVIVVLLTVPAKALDPQKRITQFYAHIMDREGRHSGAGSCNCSNTGWVFVARYRSGLIPI